MVNQFRPQRTGCTNTLLFPVRFEDSTNTVEHATGHS